METEYSSESHKRYSEECQKEVEEMLRHPLTHEEFARQIKANASSGKPRRGGSKNPQNGDAKDDIMAKGLAAFESMRQTAAEAGVQDMSLEEINRIISEVRKSRGR